MGFVIVMACIACQAASLGILNQGDSVARIEAGIRRASASASLALGTRFGPLVDSSDAAWGRYRGAECRAAATGADSQASRCRLHLDQLRLGRLALLSGDSAYWRYASLVEAPVAGRACGDSATTTADLVNCLEDAISVASRGLKAQEEQVTSRLPKPLRAVFEAANSEWEDNSHSYCRAVGLLNGGASSGGADEGLCLVGLAEERTRVLRSLYPTRQDERD